MKKINKYIIKKEKGSILIGSILMMILLLGLTVSLTSLVLSTAIATQRSYQGIIAMSQAEAAIEKTMWELNATREISCPSICILDGAEVIMQTTDIDSENKEIIAEAYVPTIANYKSKRTIKMIISATPSTEAVAFNYAIQGGAGGIDVSGSSNIEGNLYSNGDIDVSGSAAVELPGDVWAVGTVTDQNNGIEGTITQFPNVVSVPLPSIDLSNWESMASDGGTIVGDYTVPSTDSGVYTDLGPKKITGELSMSKSDQQVNLTGPLYIQGDLTISGNGEWKLDDSFGSNGTIVLVDGKINISGSAKFYGNSAGSYILFISTNAANTKTNPAIKYTGSATGEKLALYAYYGALNLAGSGKIIAMSGETLFISGSGKIEYESGLASTEFSGGPGGIWTSSSWQKVSN